MFQNDLAKKFSNDCQVLRLFFFEILADIFVPVVCQLAASWVQLGPVEDSGSYDLPATTFQAKTVCIHLKHEFRVITLFFSVLGSF